MHLITPLASGIAGAANGTASVCARGTSTRVQYYLDFEALSVVNNGLDVVLDSNGGATVYVNQYVDVTVKNSQGSIVRRFTAGDASPNVEYIGQSFTGYDYTTGQAGASRPTTLQSVLDKWKTSAGTTDYKVLFGGASTYLSTIVSGVYGLVVNVKHTSYNAIGDGTTDDTVAITAAISAANSAGGGIVFFPRGIYRITSAITVPYKVSLMGIGPHGSIIAIDHATANTFVLSGASTGGFQYVTGLRFTALQANAGSCFYAHTDSTRVKFQNCVFGSAYSNGVLIDSESDLSFVSLDSCEICPNSLAGLTSAVYIHAGTGAAEFKSWATITGCRFALSPAQANWGVALLDINTGYVAGNCFDLSPSPADLCSCITIDGTIATNQGVSIIGNWFIGNPALNLIGILLPTANPWWFYEAGNFFYDSEASFTNGAVFADDDKVNYQSRSMMTRETHFTEITDDGATVTLPTNRYGVIQLNRTTNGNQVINGELYPTTGSYFSLFIHNDAGVGSGNLSFGSASFLENVGVFTIAASRSRLFHFRAIDSGTHPRWGLISNSGDLVA